jgi:hypothetical protein
VKQQIAVVDNFNCLRERSENTQKSFQSGINNPLYLQKRQWECGKTVKNHSCVMTIVGGRAGSY